MSGRGWSGRHRAALRVSVDALAWALALPLTTLARYDFDAAAVQLRGVVGGVLLAIAVHAAAGRAIGLYRGRRRYGSFDELAVLTPAIAVASTALLLLTLLGGSPRLLPLSVPAGAGLLAFVLMGGVRYGWRLRLDRLRRPTGDGAARILVFGAGDAGAQIITALLRDPMSPYVPVALLDDDADKQGLRILGVRVVGSRRDIAEAVQRHDATALLVAIASAGSELVGELTDLANAQGLTVMVLPPVGELLGARASVGDIREVSEADLLGRHEIDTDVASIAGYLTGKRVLVTGAGGSIGSELCRQIHRFRPAEMIMVDRDESALHAVQLSIYGRALLESPELVLLDIRDARLVEELFAERRPQVVFHAAALKHLPLLEQYPGEGLRTNVLATLDLLETAQRHGVDKFVNVSTDKAADPVSVLGYTKRIAERLTAHVAASAGGIFLSVRFGNVLGSRGSVLTAFRAQILSGGPVTVTDPDVTRYFMTVEEAVQLVIQAGAIAAPGEALVLDMGAPVRIASVAERLTAQSAEPIEIVYTGLRHGEKLHEVLLGHDEHDVRPVHPLISHVSVPRCHPRALVDLDPWAPRQRLIDALAEVALGHPSGSAVPAEPSRRAMFSRTGAPGVPEMSTMHMRTVEARG
jgi:FlaA1/EpsC-like NDP-sugar epimerase